MLGGVIAFWIGIVVAVVDYPATFDWRFVTVSSLLYSDRNPPGHLWGAAGVVVCGLLGAWWSSSHTVQPTSAVERSCAPLPGFRALGFGYGTMSIAGLFPEQLVAIPKGHEMLALTAFLCLCIGTVRLCFGMLEANSRRRTTVPASRLPIVVLSAAPLIPIALAAITQFYLAIWKPNAPWVSLDWRSLGLPSYLSFAFWEWTTCALFSVYAVTLALLAASARDRPRREGRW